MMTRPLMTRLMMLRELIIAASFFAASFFAASPATATPFIIVQSTTSIQNSGLYEHLLPLFEAEQDIKVRIVAVGTGQALRNAEKCDADMVIVHSTIDEEEFVAKGFGSQRYNLMYNDFVMVGPKSDPAHIRTANSTIEAFQKLANTKSRFASRGDDSGTHKAERRFWNMAGISTKDASGKWYLETGLGMGATLNFAVQSDTYTLSDRATWLTFRNKANHEILFEGDPALFNQYGIVIVSKDHCSTVKDALSRRFAKWLLSDKGQAAITAFQHKNRPLFFPNASPAH
ncbi:substrate-binding domain-containing protein [Alphaproteobacteria bacterium LSUCC0226]